MKYKPGQSGNPSGRPKGSKDKITSALREKISLLLEDEFGRIKESLEKLSPEKRIDVFCRLLEYTIPKLTRTEVRDMTSLEELMEMSQEERLERMAEIRKQLNEK